MSKEKFSDLREFLWPIHSFELKRVLPMAVMMFFFLFNYTIMRDTKDTLILSTCPSEALSFLKMFGTLPMAMLFVILYAKLTNILKDETLFYTVITPFLIFFLSFGFILYPYREVLHPTATANNLIAFVKAHFPGFLQTGAVAILSVFGNWTYALFYILSELWGSMGISLLFWRFANDITAPDEAKRFYPRFTQLGNIALTISGAIVIYFSNIRDSLPKGVDAWGVTLQWMSTWITVGCIIILIAYWYMNHYVLTDTTLFKSDMMKKKSKPKMGIFDSFKFLIRSKYLGAIALLVIGYGISINLIEIVYKTILKQVYPIQNDMNAFFGYISMIVGITTFFLVTFSGYIIRKIGWLTGALLTPIIILITGGLFFSCVYWKNILPSIIPWLADPVWIAVLLGAGQNIFSKSAKYSLFDPTKEMSYIPLDAESKAKGKAAIDVVGARLGKSGGSAILIVVTLFGKFIENLSILFVLIAGVIFAWIRGVLFLHKHEHCLQEGKEKDLSIDKK